MQLEEAGFVAPITEGVKEDDEGSVKEAGVTKFGEDKEKRMIEESHFSLTKYRFWDKTKYCNDSASRQMDAGRKLAIVMNLQCGSARVSGHSMKVGAAHTS